MSFTGWVTCLSKRSLWSFKCPSLAIVFGRFPVYNARTDQMSELGRQYDTKPGFYMVVGPNWKGEAPSGIAGVVRSSTNFAVTMPRIFISDSPEDQASVQPALKQIQFYPLSEFDGKMKTQDWSKLPAFPVPKETDRPKYSTKQPPWVDPAVFFEQLPAIMKEVPPMPGEEALYQWIGSVLDVAGKDPEVMKTLQETALSADEELIAPMMRWRNNGQQVSDGWTSPSNNAAFGTDYYHRTGAVKADPYDNKRNETMYFYTDNDSQLKQLVGESSYAVTFEKGQLPPVKGFWSLTMYDPEHFFAPNALKRYALGTKNKTLKYNADGSLTIYLGNKSPGQDKESNWLPAAAGNFSVWIRAYGPDTAILDGTWKPPIIAVVK
jgi:hypothetical protein